VFPGLTEHQLSDILFDVKKSVKKLFQNWSQTIDSLKPGEVVEITSHGKPVAVLTKPVQPSRRMPDFRKLVRRDKASPEDGERLFKRMMSDEAIC
jgi:antitoxin (DNA-binding transcriptional repressor) of toxin-antitoxin stability system